MADKTDAELWALVIELARGDVASTQALKRVREAGGRDLCATAKDFKAIYSRFQSQPLFAAQMLLNNKRLGFQQEVVNAMLSLSPATDAQVDEWTDLIAEFEKGSFGALLKCIATVTVTRPTLAESLTQLARQLHPRPYDQLDKQHAAAAQQELPFPDAPVEHAGVPEVPEGV